METVYKVGDKLIGIDIIEKEVPGKAWTLGGCSADLKYSITVIEKINKNFIKLTNGDRVQYKYGSLYSYGSSNVFYDYKPYTQELELKIIEEKKITRERFNKLELENIIIRVKKDRPYGARDEFYVKALKEIIKEIESNNKED